MKAAPPLAPAALRSRCLSSLASAPRLLLFPCPRAPAATSCRAAPAPVIARSISVSVDAPAAAAETASASASTAPRRRLILLRHGKSAAGNRSTRDHDRPLSKSGRADAIGVSDKLQQMGWIPELILCSDATRTKETLKILQEHVQGLSEAVVHFIPSFYSIAAMDGQTAEHLQKAICEYCSNDILTVITNTGAWDITKDGRKQLLCFLATQWCLRHAMLHCWKL